MRTEQEKASHIFNVLLPVGGGAGNGKECAVAAATAFASCLKRSRVAEAPPPPAFVATI
jgi:hypothetical protein